jgi:hypothetical protein
MTYCSQPGEWSLQVIQRVGSSLETPRASALEGLPGGNLCQDAGSDRVDSASQGRFWQLPTCGSLTVNTREDLGRDLLLDLPGLNDPKFLHPELYGRPVHSQTCGRAIASRNHPFRLLQCCQDMRPFGFFHGLRSGRS